MRLRAPAKINWSLEVLGRRPDGYHEVRTVLQTIDLCDIVTLESAPRLELLVEGAAGTLAGEDPKANLAWRAAERLLQRTGASAGARIGIDKRIPVAGGLGGGSSDAAAVLRGANHLWGLRQPLDALLEVATTVGSDVPFFLLGGAALASGRGDVLQPLGDGPECTLLIAWPAAPAPADKTARMYAALRPELYTDGTATLRVARLVEAGEPPPDDAIVNVFERVLDEALPETGRVMRLLAEAGVRPHLCGAGPSIFASVDGADLERARRVLEREGWRWVVASTLGAAAATAIEAP
ncbi:MAG TPA: 4-(cytidine 5'-diphospho)-2-C-methyl-D-erythritol kinase [Dehalococcoidia bacterium]|nr:4-(cytidine 5'-diphospho)-2-C-methyl-D-erythritol kinase [Dehalococcoidia bacterium]